MTISDYQSALVTGASSGIGEAVVEDLSQRGLTVHAVARRAERLEELKEKTGCVTHVLDVRDTEEMNELFGSIAPDILINNAGVGRAIDSTVNANPEDLDQTIDTTVTAAIHAVRAVTPSMIEKGKGHIVNVGSVAGLYPLSSSVYGASKGAIHFLSTNLRLELVGTGIRVTEICPGRVRTEFYDAAIDDENMRHKLKETGITEITSADVATSITYAIDAPWHVNVARIELQPLEQTYGGVNFDHAPQGKNELRIT